MTSLRQRRPRRKIEKHLAFVRTLPCIVTGRPGVDAAHIRYGEAYLGKRAVGMAEKPDDIWVVPLHASKHTADADAQHRGNEKEFWARYGIDPCIIALALYAHSGDTETCEQILRETRKRARA